MEDLIKRSDAIKATWQEPTYTDPLNVLTEVRDRIESIPSADRPQGEWIYGEHDVAMCDGYRCDRCGFFVPWDYEHKSIDFINDYHFCPNCGCRMRKENE